MDTVFADNQVKKDFNKAYNTNQDRIKSQKAKIKQLGSSIKTGNLRKGQIRRAKKDIAQATRRLGDLKKVAKDFKTIIESPVDFIYSSDVSNIEKGFNGLTGSEDDKLYRDGNGVLTGGRVSIFVEGGHDEIIVHENRHGNQRLEGKGLTKLQRETEGYVYQRIYNAQSVHAFIESQIIDKYGHIQETIRPTMNLIEAIKHKYKIE